MKLAILGPVHGQTFDRLQEQFANYALYLSGEDSYRFYVHVSRESTDEFRNGLANFRASHPSLLRIAEESRVTSTRSCLNALIQLSYLLNTDGWMPDYIFWHSDSDLLVRTNLTSEITRYSFGVEMCDLDYMDDCWSHSLNMRRDQRLVSLVNNILSCSFSDLRIGRTEGCFMNFSTWSFVAGKICEYFDDSYFDDTSTHWCAEEVLIPTLARIANRTPVPYRNQLIYTKPAVPDSDRNPGSACISRYDIIRLRTEGIYYGAKWFSPDLDNEARQFLMDNT